MQGRTLYFFTFVQVVAVAATLWLIFSRPSAWDLQRAVGAVLVVVGIGGIAAARFQLGKSFAIRAEARQLVTRGVYARIRNPIYVFGVVLLAGLVLIVHRPILWLPAERPRFSKLHLAMLTANIAARPGFKRSGFESPVLKSCFFLRKPIRQGWF
jgi:steroid 5-alpha reductase family enzyme